MKERVEFFESNHKYLEAQRISERTKYDLEMLREIGFARVSRTIPVFLREENPDRLLIRSLIISPRTFSFLSTNRT